MSINMKEEKCKGCKYAGIYICTNSKECKDQALYIKR